MPMLSNLNTFGAILSFAIELEDTLQRYYQQAASVVAGDSSEVFDNFARKSGKRKQRLVGIRQENITEMVLEPITGLNDEDYALTIGNPATSAEALTEAIRLEERVERFYSDSGPKLNVTEPRRALQKFAQETAERLSELRQLA